MTRDQAIELLRAEADKERQAATSRRDSASAMDSMTLADAKDAAAMATRMTGRKHTVGTPREWKESARIDRACADQCEQLAAAIDLAVDALLTAPVPAGEKDHGAGLIHQAIPDVAGTEPRLNEWVAPEGYWAYHELVIAEVRKQLLARGIPRTFKERDAIAMAVRFFDVECTYDEDFARGDVPAEVAESNINAADWE